MQVAVSLLILIFGLLILASPHRNLPARFRRKYKALGGRLDRLGYRLLAFLKRRKRHRFPCAS
jgi:hypothetical protein